MKEKKFRARRWADADADSGHVVAVVVVLGPNLQWRSFQYKIGPKISTESPKKKSPIGNRTVVGNPCIVLWRRKPKPVIQIRLLLYLFPKKKKMVLRKRHRFGDDDDDDNEILNYHQPR